MSGVQGVVLWRWIRRLRGRGRSVCMVEEGVVWAGRECRVMEIELKGVSG